MKDEIILIVKQAIIDNAAIDFDADCITLDGNNCDHMAEQIAESIYAAGYRKVDEYEAEIERLNRRIAELEQDLVHADENVFYREQNVKLCEEKLKSEARKEVS